jgi:non-ribosomal peptide synthetase component F
LCLTVGGQEQQRRQQEQQRPKQEQEQQRLKQEQEQQKQEQQSLAQIVQERQQLEQQLAALKMQQEEEARLKASLKASVKTEPEEQDQKLPAKSTSLKKPPPGSVGVPIGVPVSGGPSVAERASAFDVQAAFASGSNATAELQQEHLAAAELSDPTQTGSRT